MVANVHPFTCKKTPAKIVTPSLYGHGFCDDPVANVHPFPRQKKPTKIVTPFLSRYGGCDDPWWPMCTPSCGKRSQSRSSRPCPGMVAVTIPSVGIGLSKGCRDQKSVSVGTGLSKGCRDQKSVSVGIGLSKGCRDQKSVSVGTGLPKGCEI